MPSTAIISPQIIDSTQIGRDLITAADQAAAQAIIGVTGVDVSADYTWTGDHTFQGSATFDAGVETAAITTATNLVTTLPSGGQGQYYFGLNPIYLMSATEFRPAEALTVATLGSATRRWTNVYSVDGSFSGNLINEVGSSYKLYNLGTEGDADTEYLETSFVSNVATIAAKNDGSGTARGLTLTSDGTTRIEGSATRLYVGALLALNLFSSTGQFNVNLQPASTGTKFCGSTSRRWSNVASVDGDFSGDVVMAANVDFTGLPTADPLVAGRLWNDSGTMKISAG